MIRSGSPPRRRLSRPRKTGVPASLGGEVRVRARGRYLCLSARLPEPGGKVLAHSAGRNPIWELDLRTSPPVEDRIVYRLHYRSVAGAERDLAIAINPWGAYRVEEDGKVVASATILRAAQVNPQGWAVEAAVPSTLFDIDWSKANQVQVSAERIRSRRALAPEYRWQWPANGKRSPVAIKAAPQMAEAPVVHAPAIVNTDPPLEVGRILRVPRAIAEWDSREWANIPAFGLSRNEAFPRGRDDSLNGEDHVAVYLATSGSAFVQIAVNPAGEISDAIDSGPRWSRPNVSWNANVEAETDVRNGHWLARVNIPLDECAAALGESGVPREWRILVTRHRASRRGTLAETVMLPSLEGSTSVFGRMRYPPK